MNASDNWDHSFAASISKPRNKPLRLPWSHLVWQCFWDFSTHWCFSSLSILYLLTCYKFQPKHTHCVNVSSDCPHCEFTSALSVLAAFRPYCLQRPAWNISLPWSLPRLRDPDSATLPQTKVYIQIRAQLSIYVERVNYRT